MTGCPNCHDPMTAQDVEAHGTLRPIEITACAPCNLFWFDKAESIRLTPKAVLELFQYIGKAGSARKRARHDFQLPAAAPLPSHSTQDLQRTTRFTYWRCPQGPRAAHHVPSVPAREELHPRALARRAREAARHGAPDLLLPMRRARRPGDRQRLHALRRARRADRSGGRGEGAARSRRRRVLARRRRIRKPCARR